MQTPLESVEGLGAEIVVCGVSALLAALAVFSCTPLVRRVAHRLRAVDAPCPRRVHAQTTARMGGLAVFAGILGAVFIGTLLFPPTSVLSIASVVAVLIAAAFVCGVGVVDDCRGITPTVKIAGLTVAAIGLGAFGVRIDWLTLPGLGAIELGWLALPATIVWVLACANAINLIDGVDGAASGVAAIAAFVLGLCALATGNPTSGLLFAATFGAAFGFLLHNRQPASIFLGDSGSLLLGFMLAAGSVTACGRSVSAFVIFGAAVSLAVPFVDAGQSFFRRFRAARRHEGAITTALRATTVADTGHLHHRLLRRGLSHHRVSFVFHTITAIACIAVLLLVPHGYLHWSFALMPLVLSAVALTALSTLKPRPQDASDYRLPRAPTKAVSIPRPAQTTPEPTRGSSHSAASAAATGDPQLANTETTDPRPMRSKE